MAAKQSTTIEDALQKIKGKVTCGSCQETYKKPKLLKCLHVFCELCLQHLASKGQERQSITCLHCHQDTPLPVGGVSELQGAFYIQCFIDIQDILMKVNSSDPIMCNKCKRRDATSFCRTCGFVCQLCTGFHQEWDDLKTHNVINLDTLTVDITNLVSPLKKMQFCPIHHRKETELYCETCDKLICQDCTIHLHRDHQYDLVQESFTKHEKKINDCLKTVGEQITLLERAVKQVDTQCTAIMKQKTTVVAQIHTTMANVRRALEMREMELVNQAEELAEKKLMTLSAQQGKFELQLGQLKSCQDIVEESRHACSKGEILLMMNPIVNNIKHLTRDLKQASLAPAEQVDIKFTHSLSDLQETCQQFGKVNCHPACPERCRIVGSVSSIVTRGRKVAVCVEALDREGEAYLSPLNCWRCELVASDGSSRVRVIVMRSVRHQNMYEISYQPLVTGKHQLHILIEEHPILNSPFTVTVLPDLTKPTIIKGFHKPWGIAVWEGKKLMVAVAENGSNCLSVIGGDGKKKPLGSSQNLFKSPTGVATDTKGNLFVVERLKNCIQCVSSKVTTVVGKKGSGPLEFQNPLGITIHPHTNKVYVADCGNHRIQILNSDLTYSSSFGREGINSGEFSCPHDVAIDGQGNVYVVDAGNNRIQVFTGDGEYLGQFGTKGKEGEQLKDPISIAIDTHNLIYVGEGGSSCVSIFSTAGEFIKSFGGRGKGSVHFDQPYGLAVDKNGKLYVCSTLSDCVQIFT